MFDNYGIKDIFHGIRRYKIAVAVIIIACTLLGYAYGVYNVKNMTAGNYCSSVTYFVTTKEKNGKSEDQMFNDSKEYAENVKTMLSADFCYDYVYNAVLGQYTPAEISKILSISEKDLTMSAIKNISTVSVLSGTSLVNLYVECKDEKFADTVLSCYKKYLSDEANINAFCSISDVGGVSQQLDAESVLSAKKMAILSFVAGIFISVLFVFIITLARPTLNEKGDIEQYGVPVLGEFKPSK